MGYYRHHTIIVTSWLTDSSPSYPGEGTSIETAHKVACGIFDSAQVSPIVQSQMNGWWTFFVAPDGSKEGWDESDAGDAKRESFIEWLERARYSDGSSSLKWVEVQYGDEEGDNRVLRHEGEHSD